MTWDDFANGVSNFFGGLFPPGDVPWYQTEIWGNTLTTWAVAVFFMLLSFWLARGVSYIIGNVVKRLAKRTKTTLDDTLIDILHRPIVFFVALVFISLGFNLLSFSDDLQFIDDSVRAVLSLLFTLSAAIVIAKLIDIFLEKVVGSYFAKTKNKMDDKITKPLRQFLKVFIYSMATLIGLGNAGVDITPLLASLGVMSIAVGFALQKTIENIFAWFQILIDQHFHIGDIIEVAGVTGEVKSISIRSVTIVDFEGRENYIPNRIVNAEQLKNISTEQWRKVTLRIGLSYNTLSKQIESFVELLKELDKEFEGTYKSAIAYLSEYGDFAKIVDFIYYIDRREENKRDIADTKHRMNILVQKACDSCSVEMAFPTQEVILSGSVAAVAA